MLPTPQKKNENYTVVIMKTADQEFRPKTTRRFPNLMQNKEKDISSVFGTRRKNSLGLYLTTEISGFFFLFFVKAEWQKRFHHT